jgi:hypothetical protein
MEDMAETNPYRICWAAPNGRLRSLLYPAVWDGEWEDMTETE